VRAQPETALDRDLRRCQRAVRWSFDFKNNDWQQIASLVIVEKPTSGSAVQRSSSIGATCLVRDLSLTEESTSSSRTAFVIDGGSKGHALGEAFARATAQYWLEQFNSEGALPVQLQLTCVNALQLLDTSANATDTWLVAEADAPARALAKTVSRPAVPTPISAVPSAREIAGTLAHYVVRRSGGALCVALTPSTSPVSDLSVVCAS
jgi:hypothetical protein